MSARHKSRAGQTHINGQLELLAQSKVGQEFDSHGHGGTKVTNGGYKRCYESHPALPLGDDIVVYGGSCMSPIVHDADIYIGHDQSMQKTPKAYPWNEGESVLMYIPDMGVPPDAVEYLKMLDWLCVQLAAQKKVHVGCIGGHGRTGMTLSALAWLMKGEKAAVQYVRANYCEKAVESASQVAFLKKYFGIDDVAPAKESYSIQTNHKVNYDTVRTPYNERPQVEPIILGQGGSTIYPTESTTSVWGRNVEIVKAKNT